MAYMHIGKDFVPPDVPGKVTGRIKYARTIPARAWFTHDFSPVLSRMLGC